MIDTLPLGEIGGQHAPLDPPFGHIKDGIEYGPHTQGARSSTTFGGGDHLFDPLPFLVGQVAWIYFFVHLPIVHNPRRLFRQALSNFSGRTPYKSTYGERERLKSLSVSWVHGSDTPLDAYWSVARLPTSSRVTK